MLIALAHELSAYGICCDSAYALDIQGYNNSLALEYTATLLFQELADGPIKPITASTTWTIGNANYVCVGVQGLMPLTMFVLLTQARRITLALKEQLLLATMVRSGCAASIVALGTLNVHEVGWLTCDIVGGAVGTWYLNVSINIPNTYPDFNCTMALSLGSSMCTSLYHTSVYWM
jgi:hypothetical protein